MSWPAAVLWALLPLLMLLRGPALLYMTLIVSVFMSLQMLPGEGDGANLLPVTLYAAALAARVFVMPGNVLRGVESALDMRRMGLFTAFIVYAVMSAVLLPRMFAGLVEVIPISGGSFDGPSLVQPRSGNITQSGYILVSYSTALALSVIGSRDDVRRHYLRALVATALALFATGLVDLAADRLGLATLLAPFRTASYELLTDVETNGVKRVVGLTPEASAFGALCVSAAAALLLLRPLYRPGWERLVANVALLGAAGMAILSTSTTAYAGGAVLAVVYLIDLTRRALRPGALGRESVKLEFVLLTSAAFAAVAVIAFAPHVVAPFFDLIDKVVFQKSASMSYYQRNLWTQIGWGAFVDSGGLGVGFGSVRVSNWVVAILSSTGVIGGCLIFGFVVQKVVASTRSETAEVKCLKKGLGLWLLPVFSMALFAGTIPDIGVMTAAALGMLSTAAIEPGVADQRGEAYVAAATPQTSMRGRRFLRERLVGSNAMSPRQQGASRDV